MTQADRIRQFAFEGWVAPARRAGKATVSIRAGDVHKAMGLADRLPAVCSALGTNKFLEMANLRLEARKGPNVSTTTTFDFRIL